MLLSSFHVDESGGDGSLNANYTYESWSWILVRANGGACAARRFRILKRALKTAGNREYRLAKAGAMRPLFSYRLQNAVFASIFRQNML